LRKSYAAFVELRWIQMRNGNDFQKSLDELDVIFFGKLHSIEFDVTEVESSRVGVN
jgi:hypothetical protein